MIKAIVFDFSGVLYPYTPYLGNKRPDDATYAKIDKLVARVYEANEELIMSGGFTIDKFRIELDELGGEVFGLLGLYAIEESIINVDRRVLAVIEQLRTRYRIYALVNEAPKWVEMRVYFHGLDRYFDDIFVSSYTGFKKPDQAAYKHLLEKTKLKPDECLFVDDNEKNIEAAQKLGFKVFQYDDPHVLRKVLGEMKLLV